ncbi:MAG TPA: heavy metal sensor histidine kinase [Candidatus Acidoferrales bacterium]|nr:heavy metal sensor histidine kinase [Candidatus Acidoferrales bacterium]
MNPIPIRLRLTALYSLILMLSLCVFGAIAYFAMRASIRSTVTDELEERLEGVRAIIAEEGPNGPAALEDEFKEYADGQGKDGRLRVSDASGRVLFASPGVTFPFPVPRGRWILRTFIAKIDGKKFRVLRETIYVAGMRYDVTVAANLLDFDRALDRFEIVLYSAVPIFLVLASFGGYWMSRRALEPVDEITRAARTIHAEDLAQRLTVPKTGDELERLASTLNEMLNRLEAAFKRITKFTADASHELRTPVSVMRTSAEITLRKPRSEEEYRETISQILYESERLSQLIEQLLVLARSDAGSAVLPMVRTDLTEPLRSACRQADRLARAKQLSLCESLPNQPLWVRGDAPSLERLFLVLLDNAVKYTPDGGRIEVHLSREDGFVIADIADTGIGVADEDLPHIFERFYRADRARSRDSGGSGLGLAIGSWIAQAHGGEIRVQSKIAKGSSFQIRLPIYS